MIVSEAPNIARRNGVQSEQIWQAKSEISLDVFDRIVPKKFYKWTSRIYHVKVCVYFYLCLE